jgi:hypothetical protein
LRARRNERTKIAFCTNGEDMPCRHCYCFGNGTSWIEGKNMSAVEKKIGGTKRAFLLSLSFRERVGMKIVCSHYMCPHPGPLPKGEGRDRLRADC